MNLPPGCQHCCTEKPRDLKSISDSFGMSGLGQFLLACCLSSCPTDRKFVRDISSFEYGKYQLHPILNLEPCSLSSRSHSIFQYSSPCFVGSTEICPRC